MVSMMLPEGASKFKAERKLHEEAKRFEETREQSELTSTTTTAPSTTLSHSTQRIAISTERISDVEYDEEEEEENYVESFSDNHLNEIPSMALTRMPQTAGKIKFPPQEVRDFSIDLWNGSPGLKYWGYNESAPEDG